MKRLNYVFAMLFIALVAVGCNNKAYQYADLTVTVKSSDTVLPGTTVYVYDATTWAAKTITNPDNGTVSYSPSVMSNIKQKTNLEGKCEIVLWDEMFFYGSANATVYVAVEMYVDGVYTVYFKEQAVSKKKKYSVDLSIPMSE